MVFYSIEETIGRLIVEKFATSDVSEGLINSIADREEKSGREVDSGDLNSLVQASHFSELLDIAISCNKGSSSEEYWRELKTLAASCSLYDLRNRLSHPNRPFYFSDWYRVGLFASDPVVDKLDLQSIVESLISAESNDLKDPPEEWLNKLTFNLPNNLPKVFEHSLTGLLGRNTDIRKLQKQIIKPRVSTAAIVAPGGVGKTALALDLLDNISKTPNLAEAFNGIIYISLKLEYQSIDGVKRLSAPETIEALKSEIVSEYNDLFNENHDNFDQLVNDGDSKRLLLCIDNLETLLRDSEEYFNDFNFDLPDEWTVLVTSRLKVDNSFVLPLDKLGEDFAKALVRGYVSRRGGELDEDNVELVANKCNCNPLAIKLTLDHYLIGSTLPSSLSKVRTDIAEFSFRNLVENLSDDGVAVLEILFISEQINRRSVCQYLDLSVDDAAKAISELLRTSLVNRLSFENDEFIELNSSVRDFLLLNPRNLEIRRRIKAKINKSRELIRELHRKQEQSNLSPFNEYYIPDDTPDDLKLILGRAKKALSNKNSDNGLVRKVYLELIESESVFENEFLFHRFISVFYRMMSDEKEEKRHLKRALELKDNDSSSRILLAKHYHGSREYGKALDEYEIVMNGSDSSALKSDEVIWKVILNGYYLANLFLNNLDKIYDETKSWNKDSVFGDTHGSYRAAAYRVELESINCLKESVRVNACINSCLKIFQTVIKENGYINVAVRESLKAIHQILKINLTYQQCINEENKQQFVRFCDKHLIDFLSAKKNEYQQIDIVKLLSSVDTLDNPFRKGKWVVRTNPGYRVGITQDEIAERGLTLVHVTNVPKTDDGLGRGFLFSQDAYSEQYFIHLSSLKNGDQFLWNKLDRGNPLAVKGEVESDKNALRATETYFVKE